MEELLELIKEKTNDTELDSFLKGMLIALKEELETEITFNKEKNNNYKKAIELSKTIKNVQLGCGNHLLFNYINIDINSNSDIFWDIRKSLPFADNSINRIFSEHVFEHLDYPISANKLLEESYRVLNTGGEFIIGIPDCDYPLEDIINDGNKNMNKAIQKWYKKRDDVISSMNTNLDYLNYVMRDQLFHHKYHPHYWGYNEKNLSLLLKKHGFKDIKKWKIDKSIINPKRLWGTLYLIAKK